KTKTGARLVRGEIRLKNVLTVLQWHSGSVVAYLQNRAGAIAPLGADLDMAVHIDGLDRVKNQIEQSLPQQLFISFNHKRVHQHLEGEILLLNVVSQGPHYFACDRAQRHRSTTHLSRPGILD